MCLVINYNGENDKSLNELKDIMLRDTIFADIQIRIKRSPGIFIFLLIFTILDMSAFIFQIIFKVVPNLSIAILIILLIFLVIVIIFLVYFYYNTYKDYINERSENITNKEKVKTLKDEKKKNKEELDKKNNVIKSLQTKQKSEIVELEKEKVQILKDSLEEKKKRPLKEDIKKMIQKFQIMETYLREDYRDQLFELYGPDMNREYTDFSSTFRELKDNLKQLPEWMENKKILDKLSELDLKNDEEIKDLTDDQGEISKQQLERISDRLVQEMIKLIMDRIEYLNKTYLK